MYFLETPKPHVADSSKRAPGDRQATLARTDWGSTRLAWWEDTETKPDRYLDCKNDEDELITKFSGLEHFDSI